VAFALARSRVAYGIFTDQFFVWSSVYEQAVFPHAEIPEAIGPARSEQPFSAVRLPVDLTAEIDAWANHQEISRSEAIRRLVELGLKLKK
jgi:Ribbon-helix-helix protein, copG family